MGNNCVNGNIAKDGLFNSISHSLRWSKSSDNIIIVYDQNKENIGQEPSQKAIKSRISIEINPPELVKIDDEKEDNKLSQPMKLEPPIIIKEVWPKQQPQTTDKMSEEAAKNDVEKSDQVVESAFSKEAQKPKKLDQVRRTMSLGLRVESVLKTKTGHLKEHFSLGHKLGHGQYGTTFLCTEKQTGKEFACKSIAKRKLLTHEDLRDVRREIEIMRHLSENPNVISIKGAYEDSVAVHVVMELCKGGELFDRIVQRGYYSEKKAAELTRTIIGVIESCHSSGVMHRDIKPENFLFVDNDEDSQMKTIDFGLSVFFKPGEIFTEVVGSPFYVAPEVLRKRYGPEADIWSAGVLVYILLSGVSPFWGETEQELFEDILHGDIDFASDPWPGISDSVKDLVKRMLVRDPRKRITARQLLCHPWLQVAGGVRHDKPLDSNF